MLHFTKLANIIVPASFCLFAMTARAQVADTVRPGCDSVVTEHADGRREVRYIFNAAAPRVSPSTCSYADNRKLFEHHTDKGNRKVQGRFSSGLDRSAYDVGGIPITEGVSPSGARIYDVPIKTAAGYKLVPSISLSYNSQAGNGIAGYGWNISGIPSISIRRRNLYYDGQDSAPVISSQNVSVSLDGMPVVESESGIDGYTLQTAHGNILVRKNINHYGSPDCFDVLYPDGSTAVFGYPDGIRQDRDFPLTTLADKDGNTVSFEYDISGCDYYVTRINYGNGASILFDYSARIDTATYRYAAFGASSAYPDRILTGITCTDGASVLCEYTLNHETLDSVSVLRSISLSSSTGGSLPPVTFSYGADPGEGSSSSPAFLMSGQSLFQKWYARDDLTEILYLRGRLFASAVSDAVIILPKLKDYTTIEYTNHWYDLHRYYKYGSEYPSDMEILCNIHGYFSPYQQTILTEAGFQFIEAVDVDGDGTDELVKVNNGCSVQGITDFTVKVYSFSATGGTMYTRSFSFSVNDGTHNKYYNNPAKCYYRFGNFRGDGRTQLLVISRDAGRFALIDLDGGTKLSEGTLFTTGDNDIQNVLTADFEGLGRTDLCHVTSTGIDVYSITSPSGTYFSLRKTITGADTQSLSQGGANTFVPVDLNGDGYQDIASYQYEKGAILETRTINFAYFDGNSFTTESKALFFREKGSPAVFLDADRDGLPDILHIKGDSLYIAPNENGTFRNNSTYAGIYLGQEGSGLPPGDLSVFGPNGEIVVAVASAIRLYEFSPGHSDKRKITAMEDSFGIVHSNWYDTINIDSSAYGTEASRSFDAASGFARCRAPLSVLSGSIVTADGVQTEASDYTYLDAVYHTRGLGFCGFGKTVTEDYIAAVTQTTTLDPEKFGATIAISRALASSPAVPFHSADYTYDSHSTTYGKLNPRLVLSVETDHLRGTVDSTAINIYDSFDFPVATTSTKRVTGAGAGSSGHAVTQTAFRTYGHSLSGNRYILGTLARESVMTDMDGVPDNGTTLLTTVASDSLGRPVSVNELANWTEITPSGPRISIAPFRTTHRTYDSRGNIISESVSSYGADSLNTSTYSYDSAGRWLTGATDPLGRTTTYSGYDRFGNPTVVTDRLGHSTTAVYDAWGNLTRRTHPDGTVETESRHWSFSSEPGLYCITRTATGQPSTRTWYDALGREVRSANKRFDGSWQFVTTEYDLRGRIYRTSLPYKDSLTGPTLWNTYTYDAYGRPVSYRELYDDADPKITWSYSGTSTTTTKEGIASTTTTDAAGNVVSVTDPGGTITYTLRDDGQPSAVTVTPAGTNQDIITTFGYDHYGRRTSITDPSAGTRIDTYTNNADGTSSVAHGGPNGTVTTYYDRYGRVTSVTRPEFNTAYSYGTDAGASSFGELLSGISTNRTSQSFTYDTLGRVATVTEHADSTEWLQKTYTYGTASALASVLYTTQDGDITTESYTYANGFNTGITSSVGGTNSAPLNVFTLTAENVLGLPTAVTTGTVSRTYGYDPDGLPAFRRAARPGGSVVQNLGYAFSSSTGNMYGRTDIVPSPEGDISTSESFTYDGLNRLLRAEMDAALVNPPTPPQDPMDPNADSLSLYFPGIYNHMVATYDSKGNVLTRDRITASYNNSGDPYAVSGATWDGGGGWTETFAPRLEVAMTSFDRPASVADTSAMWPEPFVYARYDYSASGRKARSELPVPGVRRWYLGDSYEKDLRSWGDPEDPMSGFYGTETVRRLWLGGDAYSAPMVLVKVNDGAWTPYNLGRDAQGSITHVMTADGELVERYLYDPWGGVAMVDSTGMVVDSLCVALDPWGGGLYSRIIGSNGYTGHEYIPGSSLINANARIYDYAIGRFLSPDPLIQDPASTQNFNRYAYCLNNPLKYTDESGEFFILDSFVIGLIGGGSERAKQMAINDARIWLGLFNVDKNDKPLQAAWHLLLRFTWELPQTVSGLLAAHAFNTFRLVGGVESVDYLHGATVLRTKKDGFDAFTLSNYIIGDKDIEAKDDNWLFQHEFGHTLQSRATGLFWFPVYGIPSFLSACFNTPEQHNVFLAERDANARALSYFAKNSKGFMELDHATGLYNYKWDFKENPIYGFDKTKSINDNGNAKAILNNLALKELIISIRKWNEDGTYTTIYKKVIKL